MRRILASVTFIIVVLFLSPSLAALQKMAESDFPKRLPLARTILHPDVIIWESEASVDSITLRISGPQGALYESVFEASEPLYFDFVNQQGKPLPDGGYTWELRASPRLSDAVRARLRESANPEGLIEKLRQDGEFPRHQLVESGYFTIVDGLAIASNEAETDQSEKFQTPSGLLRDSVAPAHLIAEDTYIQGSLCTGNDCVDGEAFGFDTIRLKENNLRILFQDTSVSPFPTTDWQLAANDTASGGANRFSIDDVDAGSTPFTIEGSAPSHSLYVDDGGQIGFGTSAPLVELHSVDGDTPTLRLEQDTSNGFAAQRWDVAGNETNFFVRDVTGGSQLAFRILAGADSNSLVIDSANEVGVGTSTPNAPLHVRRADSSTRLLLVEHAGAEAIRNMMDLSNNGVAQFRLIDTSADGNSWQISNTNSGLNISLQGSGVQEFLIEDDGDVFINGNVQVTSSRRFKENFKLVDPTEILKQVISLPVSIWNYKKDPDSVLHVGPVAEDFFKAFQLGEGDQHIGVGDGSGVALAAIQGLYEKLLEKETEIEALRSRLNQLESLLENLLQQRVQK